ncbi:MAG: dienelactone hydrolase family protein [Hyphomonadaceae bacterium]
MNRGERLIVSGHDGFALPVFAHAAQGERRGAVIVIQEIFGVTPHIRDASRFFADAGYEAFAPALFARLDPDFEATHDAEGIAQGRAAVAATPWEQVAADIQAVLGGAPGPRFVVGFCWGGAATWAAAARCRGLNAAACFYGRQIPDILAPAPLIPVMLHYGAGDASIPPENVESVRAAAPAAPLYMYDAGHGFCREGSADLDAPSRALAFARTLEWFARWR